MDDEILKIAQGNVVAEAEDANERKAVTNAVAFGILLLTAMIVAECIIVKQIDFGKPALLVSISALTNIFEGRRNKVKKLVVSGIVKVIFAILFLILYVGGLFR